MQTTSASKFGTGQKPGHQSRTKEDGERMIALSPQICTLLDDWIDGPRPDVTDEYGRKPLIFNDTWTCPRYNSHFDRLQLVTPMPDWRTLSSES